MPRNPVLLNVLITLLAVLYPFIVYLGLRRFSPRIVGVIILGLLLLRIVVLGRMRLQRLSPAMIAPVAACLIAITVAVSNRGNILLYYPVIISLALLSLFAYTLLHPPSLIEKIARLSEPSLPAKGIPYCRNVTALWCLFFALNASLALYTIHLDDMEAWLLYNGLISYLLIAALFGIEFVVRQFSIKRNDESVH